MSDNIATDIATNIALALLMLGSIYLAGRVAERRGRSFKVWAWIAGIFIGPLALPLLFLLPRLHKDPNGPKGEKRPADVIGAVKPVIKGDPDSRCLNMSLAEWQNLTMRASAVSP